MATPCGNPNPHTRHPWVIGPNPGEDGPDWFQCDGRTTALVQWSATGEIPLGRADTDTWVVPETGWYRPTPDGWQRVVDALVTPQEMVAEPPRAVEARLIRASGAWTPDAVRSLVGQTAPAYGLDALGLTADTVTVVDARIENGWVVATLSAND